jgi:SPP1 gp7 family putative phage head morphogenesis protein
MRLAERLLAKGGRGAAAVVAELRRGIAAVARQPLPLEDKIHKIRRVLARHEPLLFRVTSDTLLAAWVAGAGGWLPKEKRLQPPATGHAVAPPQSPPPRDPIAGAGGAGEPPPVVRFPQIEAAARDLLDRRILTRAEFDQLSRDARREAFTVARVGSLDALGAVRQALTTAVSRGETRDQFEERVHEALDGSYLSPGHIETVFRTNVMAAYTAGLNDTLNDPLVGDAFPFMETVPIDDSRLSELCEVASHSGLNGTGIYLRDDPEWQRLQPPRHFNCRCAAIPISTADAARRGIKYAKEWLDLGRRPDDSGHVPRVPVELPKGWQRSRLGVAA